MWEHTDTKTSVSLGLKHELSVRDDLVEPAQYNIKTLGFKIQDSRFKMLYLSRGKLLCNSYNTKWEEEN